MLNQSQLKHFARFWGTRIQEESKICIAVGETEMQTRMTIQNDPYYKHLGTKE